MIESLAVFMVAAAFVLIIAASLLLRKPRTICPKCGDGPYPLTPSGVYQCECSFVWWPNNLTLQCFKCGKPLPVKDGKASCRTCDDYEAEALRATNQRGNELGAHGITRDA